LKPSFLSYERGVQPTLDKADKILKTLGVTFVLGQGDFDKSPEKARIEKIRG
jgi:hypothetical protein